MVAELISPSCTASDALIESEHSVLVPMPFLAERFPNARFIPLALRGGWNASAISALAERLDELLAPDDLVVASVDFSHALPLASAEQEDVLSRQLLESGDPNALSAVRADSPEALAVAMRFAQLRRAGSISILRHANSAELLDARDAQNTTSYFTAAFAQ
jgi:poly-gamma-glutamate synthesis protein (capsule biosynthesis protein)